MFRLALTLCLLTSFNLFSFAQKQDLTGTWSGNSYWLSTQIKTRYEIEQKGNKITGFVYSYNKNDSSKSKLEGTFTKGKLTLKTTEFVYKVGTGCLCKIDLKYTDQDGFKSLSGRWKGTLDIKTCAPGVSGRIELFKVEPQHLIQSEVVVANENVKPIDKNDFEGNELVKALSDRKYYALVIAIQDYEDEKIVDLENPVGDALSLTNVLGDFYTFQKKNISLLTNPTRSEIIEAFDKLANEVKERDNLLIFYAGHGIWDDRLNQGFWLPSNASLSSKAQWLSNSTIRDYISGIRSKHTLLITDACFSGSIFKERAVFTNSRAILEMYKLPSRKAMTSGALKTVPDKSVFIQYLTKGLQTNDHPLLSAEQLFRKFKVAVINNSPNGQVPQYGPIGQAGDEGGDFIFLRKSENLE